METINDHNKEMNLKIEQLLDKLINLHYFELQDFVISPNDEEVLLVYGNTDMPHEEYAFEERNRSIWKFHIESGELFQLTTPKDDANTPCWSPDGQKIAYLSRESGKKGLWVMDRSGKINNRYLPLNFQERIHFQILRSNGHLTVDFWLTQLSQTVVYTVYGNQLPRNIKNHLIFRLKMVQINKLIIAIRLVPYFRHHCLFMILRQVKRRK